MADGTYTSIPITCIEIISDMLVAKTYYLPSAPESLPYVLGHLQCRPRHLLR